MTQVNLLPPEARARQRARRVVAAVIAGAVIIVALLVFVYVLQAARLSRVDKDLTAQQATNGRLETQIAALSQFAKLRDDLNAANAQLGGLLSGQVLWSGVLQDVSMIIPDNMTLSSMNGSLNDTSGGAQVSANGLIGTITFSGVATDRKTVALWLTRLEEEKGWVNAWVSSVTSSIDTSGNKVVQFSGSVDLTSDASTPVPEL
jgi:Tfp pilus assembly protein PilN